MEPSFATFLGDPNLSPYFIDCVLDAIAHGQPLKNLKPSLISIIKNESNKYMIRCGALRALINACQTPVEDLKELLELINTEKLSDENQDLRGIILCELYPKHLSPKQVLKYIFCNHRENYFGAFQRFLMDKFLNELPDESIIDVLNQLTDVEKIKLKETDFALQRLLPKIIYKGLKSYGNIVPIDKVYKWLWIGLDENNYHYLDKEYRQPLVDWAKENQDKLLEIYSYYVDKTETEKLSGIFYNLEPTILLHLDSNKLAESLLLKARLEKNEERAKTLFYFVLNKFGCVDCFLNSKTFVSFLKEHKKFEVLYKNYLEESEKIKQKYTREKSKFQKDSEDKKRKYISFCVEQSLFQESHLKP